LPNIYNLPILYTILYHSFPTSDIVKYLDQRGYQTNAKITGAD